MTTKPGKYFHRDSTLLSPPLYSRHPDAFKLAGHMVLDGHEAAAARPHNDHLVYPVLYLYRHCLELKLKELVTICVTTGDLKGAEVKAMLKRHVLEDLWKKVKPVLRKSYPKRKKELAETEAVILKYHRIDKDGQTTRYDRDTDGKPHPYRDILPSHIVVGELRAEMQSAYDFLDGSYIGIADQWADTVAALPD